MTEHTPTPWTHDAVLSAGERVILAGDDEIALVYVSDGCDEPTAYPAMANAAYIVKACNAFPDLVKALEMARSELSYIATKHGYVSTETAIIRVDQALAAVKGAPDHG